MSHTPIFKPVFKNLSGIEYEITEFSGKHQRLVSQREEGIDKGSLEIILSDIIVRVGSVKISNLPDAERLEFVKKLPSEDRKKALFVARQYTYEDNTLDFIYHYVSKVGAKKGLSLTHKVFVEDINAMIQEFPYPNQVTELKDFPFEQFGMFPKSKEEYRFRIRTGESEEIMMRDKNPSSHTMILASQPKVVRTTNKQGDLLKEPVPVVIDFRMLDSVLSVKDIETLRGHINKVEGKFKSTIGFPHPETSEDVILDLLQIPAFYLPSIEI